MLNVSLRWPSAVFASLLLLGTAAAQGGEIVQTGSVFTGVIQGNRSFEIPIELDGYSGRAKLLSVEVSIDVRMSGEYTIQPTPVSPNGIVEAHSSTLFTLGKTDLAKVNLAFTPIPWVFPVNFPLNILWIQDGSNSNSFTDKATLRDFKSRRPITMTADIDIDTLVKPTGWADPHLAGVFATWTVKYVFE